MVYFFNQASLWLLSKSLLDFIIYGLILDKDNDFSSLFFFSNQLFYYKYILRHQKMFQNILFV